METRRHTRVAQWYNMKKHKCHQSGPLQRQAKAFGPLDKNVLRPPLVDVRLLAAPLEQEAPKIPDRRKTPPCWGPAALRRASRPTPAHSPALSPTLSPALVLSVDRGHLVQAVLFGFEPQVSDAVGHVHSLRRVGVGAGGRVGRHGAGGVEEREAGLHGW